MSSSKAWSPLKLLNIYHAILQPAYWWYEKRLERKISEGRMPQHLGLILDGNRRFAKALQIETHQGHDFGAHKAYEVIDWCVSVGIPHVTLWVFSSDNKSRDPQEVAQLLELFAREAHLMLTDPRIHHNKVRIKLIGQIEDFPESVQEALRNLEQATEHYDSLLVNIAIGYGGREEIVDAVRNLLRDQASAGRNLQQLADNIDVDMISQYMYTAGTPDPDFIIRTSGEIRLSGFLLWQSAYSEYYFCDVYWPAFRRVDFLRAIRSFQDRKRRFGR